jgi:hypothetical protein
MAADQAVSDVLKNYPIAPTADPSLAITVNGTSIPVGPLVIISPLLQREHDAIANVDYSTGQHQLGFRFLLNQAQFILPVNSTQSQFNQGQPVHSRKISLNDTWTMNNHMVNDFRLQYSYYSLAAVNPCTVCPPEVTILELGGTTVGRGRQHRNRIPIGTASRGLSRPLILAECISSSTVLGAQRRLLLQHHAGPVR